MRRLINASLIFSLLLILMLSFPSSAVEEKEKKKTDEQEETDVKKKKKEAKEEDIFDEEEEGAIGDRARWDKLSLQVISGIIKNNEDIGTMLRKVGRAKCNIEARITNRLVNTTSTGRLSFSFYDKNDDGALTGDEVEVDIEDSGDVNASMYIKDFKGNLKVFMLCNIYNLFQLHHVKTKEVKAGYVMTLKPILDASGGGWLPHKSWELKVSKDYKILEVTAKFKDDSKAVLKWKHKKAGGKWVTVGYTNEYTGDTIKQVSDCAYTFDIKKGILFLNKIEIENVTTNMGMSLGSYQEYLFSGWKIKERKKQLGIPLPGNAESFDLNEELLQIFDIQ